ncbi:hypothetical protein [Zooshikella ganghwensis]|uniref:Uncharacterized protein n=1 Tax=Zooshikella ganghwensis TaxID=202772 RepID=A0A4P9VQB8_9GAMM|nr:hypothetical protein [Zooshikella ganghwensis]RDH44272.1 hypothetical protein B9G39_12910 [Zooshikella ganghwensis]
MPLKYSIKIGLLFCLLLSISSFSDDNPGSQQLLDAQRDANANKIVEAINLNNPQLLSELFPTAHVPSQEKLGKFINKVREHVGMIQTVRAGREKNFNKASGSIWIPRG